ncbi:MAG: hypothetical protein IH924_12620, partial [Proteobacteria bacterium]|nr:hypothetical protein [Pseudomonadota bacterium]
DLLIGPGKDGLSIKSAQEGDFANLKGTPASLRISTDFPNASTPQIMIQSPEVSLIGLTIEGPEEESGKYYVGITVESPDVQIIQNQFDVTVSDDLNAYPSTGIWTTSNAVKAGVNIDRLQINENGFNSFIGTDIPGNLG